MKKYDITLFTGGTYNPVTVAVAKDSYSSAVHKVQVLDATNKVCGEAHSCKDYLNDVMYSAFHTINNVSSYSLSRNNWIAPDLKNPRLVFFCSGPAYISYPRFLKSLDAANAGLATVGVKEKIVIDNIVGDINSKEHGMAIVFKLPKFVLKAPPLFSLSIMALRSFVNFDKNKQNFNSYVEDILLENSSIKMPGFLSTNNSDVVYLQHWPSMIKFLKEKANIYKIFSGTAKENWGYSTRAVHSKFGIANFCALIQAGTINKTNHSYGKIVGPM